MNEQREKELVGEIARISDALYDLTDSQTHLYDLLQDVLSLAKDLGVAQEKLLRVLDNPRYVRILPVSMAGRVDQ